MSSRNVEPVILVKFVGSCDVVDETDVSELLATRVLPRDEMPLF